MAEKLSIPAKLRRELKKLREENAALRLQLADSEQTLAAIRGGEVDALMIDTPQGQRIFTLQGAEHAYRALIEQMSEGALTLRADGVIHYCNHGFARMLQQPLEQVIGTPVQRYLPAVAVTQFESLLRQGASGPHRSEITFLTGDGAEVPTMVGVSPLIDVNHAPLVSAVVSDLTAAKRVERILANAQFSRRLIDSIPIGVAVVGKDLRYQLVNPAYQAIVGENAPPMVGRAIAEVFGPEIARIIVPAVQQALEKDQVLEFHERETPINGRSWWRVTDIPLHDRQGKPDAVLIVAQDVTQRKLADEDLKAAKLSAEHSKAQAEAASKAKDHFLAVLSHELRTPLAPVVATLGMLQEDTRFDAETRENLEMIRRNVDLEARLIDDLLDITRIERGKVELDRQPVELGSVVRQAIEVCMPDIEARELKLSIKCGKDPFPVQADAGRLQQVFWNLLKNAIKFTPVGGHIGARCSRDSAGYAIIEIHDSGRGIEPELLSRIFKAFEQGDRQTTRDFGGLGLGLAISKAIVDLHQGSLTASSPGKGRGAVFTVRLPMLPEAAPVREGAAPPAPPSLPSRPSLRILLVEDHGDTARTMRRLLTREGNEVQLAPDINTALKLAGTEAFDLMLSDLGLPDGSGLDLIRTLRGSGSKLPAIALSGYGQEQDVRHSREAGFSAHLVKPITISKLQEAIARTLAEQVG